MIRYFTPSQEAQWARVETRTIEPPITWIAPGTAVFMYGNPNGTPPPLLHSLKHYKVLHERVVFLAVVTEEIPVVAPEARVKMELLGEDFHRITLHYGFTEDPEVTEALKQVPGMEFNLMQSTFLLGRERLIATRSQPGMAIWRERLFASMSQNSRGATSYFCIPPNRVVELGAQIEI